MDGGDGSPGGSTDAILNMSRMLMPSQPEERERKRGDKDDARLASV